MELEDINEEFEQPSGTTIPVALASLGIVLGLAGLYFGFTAKQDLNSMSASMQESTDGAVQTEKALTAVNFKLAELEQQISEQVKTISRLRAYDNQREKELKKFAADLNTHLSRNRDQIVKNAQQLEILRTSGAIQSPEKKTGSAIAVESAATASQEKIYTIMSGDTFSKIASKFGVSVESIIDANPGVDPRRLAIDQEIVIPGK